MAVSNKKKKKNPLKIESDNTPSIPVRLVRSRFGLVGVVVSGLVLFAIFGSILWGRFGPTLFHPGVMTKNITVTPQPKWIQVDVKEEVFRDNGWVDGTLSVEDPKVTETVLAGFRVHPWVKKVLFVVKRPPAAIDVQIEYRKPVATVMTFANGKNGLLTVDDEGVLLSPWEVFRPLVHKLPVIDAPGSDPSDLNAGQPWGDKRIIAGAQIAEMIGLEKWGEYGLYKIEARWPDDFRKQQNDPEFVLSSQSGNEVIWGRFPTPKQPQTGEPTPKRKLAMLAAAVKQNGSLANKKQAAPVDLRRDGG